MPGASAQVVCDVVDYRFGRAQCGSQFFDLSNVWLREWSVQSTGPAGFNNLTLYGCLTGLRTSYLSLIALENTNCPGNITDPTFFNVSGPVAVDCYSSASQQPQAQAAGSKNFQSWVFTNTSGNASITIFFAPTNNTNATLLVNVYCDPQASPYDIQVNVVQFIPPNFWVISIPSASTCQAVPECGLPPLTDINGPWPMFQAARSRVGQTPIKGPLSCRLGWKAYLGSAITGSPIIGPKGRTFVGTIGHQLFAIDGKGNQVWRQPVFGAVRTPMIAVTEPFNPVNTTLYVPVLNTLLAIHPSTHQVLWNITHPDFGGFCTTAAFSDFNLYFTGVYFTCGSTLYFANAKSGRVEWQFAQPAADGLLTPAAVDLTSGNVYVGNSKGLFGVDPTGTQIFFFNETGVVGFPTISNHGNSIYFNGVNNFTYSVGLHSGLKQWYMPFGGGISSSALGPDCTIVLGGDDGVVRAFGALSGLPLWNFTTGKAVESSPAIDGNNVVYIGSDDGKLYALNGTDGSLLWSLKTSSQIIASPAIAEDGSVVVGSLDGYLYSVSPDSAAPPCNEDGE